MEVVVDGDHNFALEGSPTNVLAAVAAASKYLRDQGRAIVGVKADGADVPYQDLQDELGEEPLENIKVLEIQSEEITKLVADALRELEQALPDLAPACRDLAAVFQSERPEEGFEPFRRLAEIWRQVKSRQLQVASALDIPLGTREMQGQTIEQLHVDLNTYLEEAADAMEKQDTVLLADLLEYELAPRAEQESAIVSLLKEEAAKTSA